MNAYAHKLLSRAEGIWSNLGLLLEGQKTSEQDGCTSIVLKFHEITPSQAEILVSQMGKAFRRANPLKKKKKKGEIVVRIEITPMNG